MPESTEIMFDPREITRVLLKDQAINEGLWHLTIQFGFAGTNVSSPAADGTFAPGLIAVVTRIGLKRADEQVAGLTVDAAVGDSQEPVTT